MIPAAFGTIGRVAAAVRRGPKSSLVPIKATIQVEMRLKRSLDSPTTSWTMFVFPVDIHCSDIQCHSPAARDGQAELLSTYSRRASTKVGKKVRIGLGEVDCSFKRQSKSWTLLLEWTRAWPPNCKSLSHIGKSRARSVQNKMVVESVQINATA